MFMRPLALCVAGYLATRVLPNSQQMLADFEPGLGRIEPALRLHVRFDVRWAMALSVMFWASVLTMTRVSEFLYFQF